MDKETKKGLKLLYSINNWGEGRPDFGKPNKTRWDNAHNESAKYINGIDNVIMYETYDEWKKAHEKTQRALDCIKSFIFGNPRLSVKRYNALIRFLGEIEDYEVGYDKEEEKLRLR